jgi:hypothetical protein
MTLPILKDKREVRPINTGISIHQIRGGNLGAATPTEAFRKSSWH